MNDPTPKQKPKKPFLNLPPRWRLALPYVVLALLLLWTWQEALQQITVRPIDYSEFKERLARGEIAECDIGETDIEGKIIPKSPGVSETQSTTREAQGKGATTRPDKAKPFMFRTIRVEDPKLVEELQRAKVRFVGVRPSFLSQFLWAWVLPIGAMVLLWMFISRRMGAAGESVLSFGKSKAKLVADKDTGVTFGDVAGCDEAKAELKEIVDFLQNPDRYKSLGAKIPKGALLVGPPGTGKTLLARAVAGEAKVPFFSMSGSDFVEMFVGVGAARVRDLFQQAKNQAPCIVFIDEIDAIGRSRGVHIGMVNDEREQTLNQLLAEMDGFEANAGVIILAATNRPEVLDRALLRPGRFDRQVLVDAPDLEGRVAILNVHARDKRLASDIDLRRIAQSTPGFSGADLANAMNEAALLAARRGADCIAQKDLEEAVEKVVAGPERKSRRLNDQEKKQVAYHEVGHALVAAYSAHADPVHKISIVPRGRAALGYTMQLPTDDQFLMSRSELLDRIKGLLGGRVAEELVFGDVTTGAEKVLERATTLARQMVCMFGMGSAIGLMHCGQRQGGAFLAAPDAGLIQRDCSEQTARQIDEEVKQILDGAYNETKSLLAEHREELTRIAEELLRRETLDREAFEKMLKGPRPAPVLPMARPVVSDARPSAE